MARKKDGSLGGGHRVPLLARWPGQIPRGTESDKLVALTDILATLADLLEEPLPDDAGEDSFSFLGALLGEAASKPAREAVVHESNQGLFAIRRGKWKLILGRGGGGIGWSPGEVGAGEPKVQRYNLEDDPGETTNLALKHSETIDRLRRRLEQIRERGRTRP